jgi:hypothetical protein
MKIYMMIFICLMMLTACNESKATNQHLTQPTHNPTANEVIKQNPNADIFQLNGILYKNASNIEWVETADLTIGEPVGTITEPYKEGATFKDSMGTKLPIGTQIFEPVKKNGPILIIKLAGKEIRYLGLIEG